MVDSQDAFITESAPLATTENTVTPESLPAYVWFQSGDGSVGEEAFWPYYYGKHYGKEFEDILID